MAYKVSILNACDSPNCQSRANFRVHNRRGSGTGDKGEYCKPHADKRVRDLNREEEAADAASEKRVDKHIQRVRFNTAERMMREKSS